MLHVKCPTCEASYKLSEDLYRRKAAGFGVVVTCRHCKTEIHVQDEVLPAPERAPERSDFDSDTPTRAMPAADVKALKAEAAKLPTGNTARAATANAADGTPTVTVPRVAPKPAAPRPGLPRPGAPPRPGVAPRPAATAALDAVTPSPTPARGEPSTPNATSTTTAERVATLPSATTAASAAKDQSSPKLVALSPGLLGVGTALEGRTKRNSMDDLWDTGPDSAPESQDPPTQRPPKPASASDAPPPATDSEIPVASTDFVAEPAPDSAAPLDSKDYVEEPPKRLPQAPPVRRFPGAPKAPAKAEVSSTTSAPKIDALVHDPALALTDKKGAPRKRQASGDLTDDLLSADLGFDAPGALAPPDADALLRPPLSQRAPAIAAAPADKPALAAPPKPPAEKSSGRGLVWVALLIGLGGAAFFFRDRIPGMGAKSAPVLEPAARTEPEPPPAAPAPVPPPEPATAEPAPEPAASAAPEPVEPVATAPSPAPEPAPAPATPRPAATGRPSTPSTPATAAAATAKPAPTATAKPAPAAPTEPREPRVEGTGPFDAAAARASLETAAAVASSCRKDGDPSGVAVVTITFSPTGRVTTANIGGPPFAATPTGGCIASTMRKARVPPFAGEMVTVRKTVTIQ
ncbi:MAG TPA: hypothetical protein VGK73_15955 [Polyangiaceae bacterium]